MIALLDTKRDEIHEACRRHRVRRLEVFGSAGTGRFDQETSDVDFLVEFHPMDRGHADAYFGLLEDLHAILARPVDLVMTDAIRNRYFLEAIQSTREVFYGD